MFSYDVGQEMGVYISLPNTHPSLFPMKIGWIPLSGHGDWAPWHPKDTNVYRYSSHSYKTGICLHYNLGTHLPTL